MCVYVCVRLSSFGESIDGGWEVLRVMKKKKKFSDSPDEVQQGVGRAGDGLAAVLRVLLLGGAPRVDDGHHDDAHHHSHERGPQVVGHGDEAQPTGALGVQGGQSRHQAAGGANQSVIVFLGFCFVVGVVFPK